MEALDRARLANGVFPYSCRIVTRFADCSRNGRLQDGAIADLFQEGRARFIHANGYFNTPGYVRVIAATTMDYVAPLSYPDPVDVCTAVVDVGRTSYRYAQIIKQNDRICAFAEVVQVLRDDRGPTALPDTWRAKYETLRLIGPSAAFAKKPQRLNRERLENRSFPHRCELTTRFGDLDRVGHINNVATVGFLQEARYRYCDALGLSDSGHEVIGVAAHVEYADDLLWPEPVEVSTLVLDVGRTSFRLGHIAAQANRIGVYAEATLVLCDTNGPTLIPDGWRANLEAMR